MIRFAVLKTVLTAVLGFLLLGGGQAVAQSSDDPSPHSEGALEVGVSSVAPGEPFPVALRIDMEEGWHSYWKNPGDAGKPTTIDWDLPEGWTADSLQWPYPHRIQAAGVSSYGYSDVVRHPVRITPPDTLTPGTTVTLKGEAKWLICEEVCLPAREDLERSLTVDDDAPSSSEEAEDIRAAQDRIPGPVDDWTAQAAQSSGSYTLALTSETDRRPDLSDAYFYPAEKGTLDHAAPQPVTRQGDTYLISLQASDYAQGPAERLQGVVVAPEGTTWDAEGEERAMTVDVPVDSSLQDVDMAALSAQSSGAGGGGLSLSWALAFAFAGGLLLNLMPCVFPVLSVKILGFAEGAGENDGAIRRHGLLFGAGVLVSMWVLAGLLLALRAAGGQIGWGFQLQSPTFVALMTLLFFGIGLNLLGVVEVGNRLMNWGGRLQSETPNSGNTGAFLTGVLATIVATPCTAPFMGAALGVALTLSPTGALLIFTVLGLGMATPYVGLSMSPRLLDALPEPGTWMETLKQFFAFPMFATAVWLVWVFGQQTSNSGVALLLGALLLMGMAAWVVHRWTAPRLSRSLQLLARGMATLMLVGAVVAAVVGAGYSRPAPAASDSANPSTSSEADWQSYSPEAVDSLRAEGRPVFVDFTAAWCLTCQVNKRTVLSEKTVTDAFAEHNVALIRADWTNRDSTITNALESHGRSGVPVYVLYPGDGSEPDLLPEVLTEDIVLDALDALPESTSS
ncbi:MAG: protein-disulfide reductase DsbD family protein [Salinivenus sp.]